MMSHSSIPSFGQSSSVQSESTTGSGQAKNSNSLVFAAELSENSSTNAVLRGESEEGSGTSTGEFGVIQASSPQNSSWTFGVSSSPQNSSWTFGVSSSPQNSSWTFGTSVPGFDSSVTPTFRDFPSAFAGFARSSNGMLGSSSTFGHTSDPSGKQSSPLLFGCKSTCNSSTGGSTSCNISIGVPKAKLPLLSTLTLSAPSSASGSSLPTFGASTPTLKRSSSSCSASFGWSSGAQYESTTAFGQANNSNGNASAPELSDNSSTNAVLKRDSEIGGTPAGVFGATQASASQNSTLKCGALCPPLRTSISASGVASSPKFGNAATSFGG